MSQSTRITIRSVVEKPTSRGPIYELEGSDGVKYSTFAAEIAGRAYRLIGQQVQLDYTEAQKPNPRGGFYTNFYLDDVHEITAPMMQVNIPQIAPPGFAGGISTSSAGIPQNTDGSEREKRIMRQTAAKVVAQLAPMLDDHSPEGLVRVCEWWVSYFEQGAALKPVTLDDVLHRVDGPMGQVPVPTADSDIPF